MGASGYLTAAQVGIGAYTSYEQAKALKAQGKVEEQLSNQNARFLELQAQDAIARGDVAAEGVKKQGRFIKGSQRAGFAGQHIAVGTGTAAAIQNETDTMSSEDALTVKNNAFLEAWGYKTNAINERFRGRMARLASKNDARNTLLTGGLNAARDVTNGVYLSNRFKNTGTTPSNGKGG